MPKGVYKRKKTRNSHGNGHGKGRSRTTTKKWWEGKNINLNTTIGEVLQGMTLADLTAAYKQLYEEGRLTFPPKI